MVRSVIGHVLFRLAVPIVLLSAVLFRYNVFSLVYLFLLLANPLLPGATSRTSSRRAICYLRLVVAASTVFCICQVVYQIVLMATQEYSQGAPPVARCSTRERLFSLIGLHRADGIGAPEAVRLLGMDFLVLLIAAATLVVCDKIVPEDLTRSVGGRRRRRTLLMLLGEFLVLVLMAAAGILHASLVSLAYFVGFLWAATWLGMQRPLARAYRAVRTALLLYSAAHFVALYAYQLDYLQEMVPASSLEARLLGLTSLRVPTCNASSPSSMETDPRVLVLRPVHWTLYLSPLAVLSFYFMVATVTRYQLLQQPKPESPAPVLAGGGGLSLSHGGRADSKRSSQRSAISFSKRRRRDSGVNWEMQSASLGNHVRRERRNSSLGLRGDETIFNGAGDARRRVHSVGAIRRESAQVHIAAIQLNLHTNLSFMLFSDWLCGPCHCL